MKNPMTARSLFHRWFFVFLFTFLLSLLVNTQFCVAASGTYTVKLDSGYLNFRSDKSSSPDNIIGYLFTNDTLEVSDSSDSLYWYAYSPKLNLNGYVCKNYLVSATQSTETSASSDIWTVKVEKGYLALRTAKAYDTSNEIGELYTGDAVKVTDSSDAVYWYVSSPRLKKEGYVNKNYLESAKTYTVKVDNGHLALRKSKSSESSVEIEKLYSGESVVLRNSSDTTYWYVYVPSLDRYGYVNKNYLVGASLEESSEASSGESSEASSETPSDSPEKTYKVHIPNGTLMLRSTATADSSNLIGKLYAEETVKVLDSSDPTYYYIYVPRLKLSGYASKKYIY